MLPVTTTYAAAASRAQTTLMRVFYAGRGKWRDCDRTSCPRADADWGDDSATNVLLMRYAAAPGPRMRRALRAIAAAGRTYPAPCAVSPCASWSDTPAWDAVAFARLYAATHQRAALQKAEAAYAYVRDSAAFYRGACPGIPYQQAGAAGSSVKTLETDANETTAALLLYRDTGAFSYLNDAQQRYARDRAAFLSPRAPLYTVHLRDDGTTCAQVPGRYFASVNGAMVWNGIELASDTGDPRYGDEAIATARAASTDLSDASGVFDDIAGENDVAEPLVQAMYRLARAGHAFAAAWILRNAQAALSARAPDGTFSRIFDGPPQTRDSIWESNGGLALEVAAAALDGTERVPDGGAWDGAQSTGASITTLPATVSFDGSAIALVGTIGTACLRGHVHVLVDGVETFDRTGLWENGSMPSAGSVFFAWRWRHPGRHTITLVPADAAEMEPDVMNLQSVIAGTP